MTGKPTEKMVWRLNKLGFAQDAISQMSYETASAIIGQALGSKENQFKKTVQQPEIVNVEKVGSWKPREKPSYNPASQYVSYAKDVFLELRKMLSDEYIANPKLEVISDDVVMNRAIQLVKIAIKEFE